MLAGINFLKQLPEKEKYLIEAFILVNLYKEICIEIPKSYKICLSLNVSYKEVESFMKDANFLIYIINDILLTQEYSLAGIANFIRIPEEIIHDVICGVNKMPSSLLWRKIIELHCLVRKDLYQKLINKIINDQLNSELI